MRRPLLFIALVLSLGACGPMVSSSTKAPPPSARGGYTFDLSDQPIKVSTPMVAKPLATKLFVVIDPAQVADAYLIDDSTHGVTGFRAFFERGLKKTLSAFFSDITFVAPGFPFPATPHFVAQARADRISANNIVVGMMTHAVLQMNWAFAIRPSTQEEFSFSFSGVAKSEMSYHTLYIGAQQVMTSTLQGLLQAWTDKDVYQALAHGAGTATRPPDPAGDKPILAVFDVQDASHKLDQDTLVQLTTYLSTLLLQKGRYRVVPRAQVRARLLDEKKGSYRECMDESCQIELGRALAAELTLSTTLIKVGTRCAVTSTLFDLKTETGREGASAETACTTEDLLGAMKKIADQL